MRNKIFLTWIATLTAAIMGVLAVTILPSAMIPAQGVPEMGEVKWDVIIDAGHGGFDGGAVADDGTLEKDVNLAISQKLSEILRCMGVRVLMTRETDEGLENPEDRTIRQKKLSDMRRRLAIMEESGAGVFVSIHLNKYSSEGPKGAQVFYSARKEESKDLAFSIQKSISDTLQKDNDRKIKQGTSDTFLLHKATIPAVIVECGFLSNPQELSAFKTEDYQMQMAVAIATGILNYMGSENNGNKK